jgi:hypothetical protein
MGTCFHDIIGSVATFLAQRGILRVCKHFMKLTAEAEDLMQSFLIGSSLLVVMLYACLISSREREEGSIERSMRGNSSTRRSFGK